MTGSRPSPLDPFDRVDLGDDDMGAHPAARMAKPRPHSRTRHHDRGAGHEMIGGADDAVDGGLPGA